MVSTSDVLDRHLKSFVEYDLDGVLADYSPDAVLFVPSGPLKGPDAIRPLFQGLVSEFAKPGSSFTMQERYIEGDHAYILWNCRNSSQFVRIRDRYVCRAKREDSSPILRGQDQTKALNHPYSARHVGIAA